MTDGMMFPQQVKDEFDRLAAMPQSRAAQWLNDVTGSDDPRPRFVAADDETEEDPKVYFFGHRKAST